MNAPDAMGGSGAPRVPPAAGIIGLSHIAIATRGADADAALLVAALGGTRGAEELLDQGALRVLFVTLGPVTIELLEPRAADHTVAKFLETRGPGLHHVSYEVADLSAALERCRAAGVRLIDETPRAGAQGSRVAFLHPKSVGGVLIELCESRRRI
jgi:methylmalonyl-CoA/ethylmalonyl-CoA epimerase